MTNMKFSLSALIIVFFVVNLSAQTFTFDFSDGYEGWSGDFADYPAGMSDSVNYQLQFLRTTLPAPLNTSKFGLKISGNNHSDDLFMFIKRKISSLLPNTTYRLLFHFELASKAPTNAVGVGGAPGEGVTIKAGASKIEPMKVKLGTDYRMNIDKGNQKIGGVDMDVLGHVGVTDTTTVFTLISRSNTTHLFTTTTNAVGEIWVCIGTDSGFEALTTLYYTKIKLVFTIISELVDIVESNKTIVFPNPTSGKVTINSEEKPKYIEVYNLMGEKITVVSDVGNQALYQVDLSAYSKGVYMLKIFTEKNSHT